MAGVNRKDKEHITHAGNGRAFHLPGVQNVKFDGYCAQTIEVCVRGVFLTRVSVYAPTT